MGRLAIILLVIGGVVGWFWYSELTLSSNASATPEEITLEQLANRGPSGNPNLKVKDFIFGMNFALEKDKSGSWRTVYIPAFSLKQVILNAQGQPDLERAPIKVIVKTTKPRNEKDVETINAQQAIEGMVINEIASLGAQEKKILGQQYPGTDIDKCVIFELERKPSQGGMLILMGGGALALVVAGAVVGIIALKKPAA